MGAFADLLPPVLIEIRAKATELTTELNKVKGELDEAAERGERSSTRMGRAFETVGSYGQTLAKGIVGLGVTVGGFAVESATAAEVVDAKLRTAIKNAGGDYEELEPKIDKTDATLRKFGFTNDQTNTALSTLTVAIKNPEKAMGAMSVAADLARAKNIDLNTASLLVAKAMEGQTRPLKALGIDLQTYTGGAQNVLLAQQSVALAQQRVNAILQKSPDAANAASKAHNTYTSALLTLKDAQERLSGAQQAGTKILDELKGRVDGAAGAYGKTLRGQLEATKANVEAMGESLGKVLIPWINKAIQIGTQMFDFLNSHRWILEVIAGIFGVVLVAGIAKWVKSFYDAALEFGGKIAGMLAKADTWVTGMISRYTSMGTAAEASAATQTAAGVEAANAAEASAMRQMEAAGQVEAADEAMAATAEEAGLATEAAGGPVTLILGLIITAVGLLLTHWKEVWSAIQTAMKWAYDNVIKPVGDFIVKVVLGAISSGVKSLERDWDAAWKAVSAAVSWVYNNVIKPIGHFVVDDFIGSITKGIHALVMEWNIAWGAVSSAVSWVYNNVIKPIGNFIVNTFINPIVEGIQFLENVWDAVWGGIARAVQAVWNFIKPIFDAITGAVQWISGAISKVGGFFSSVGHGIAHFFGFADGGTVPGQPGEPHLAIVHGGEYVLSRDMLAGRTEPTGLDKAMTVANPSAAALTGGAAYAAQRSGGAMGQAINVYVQTNATPSQIASSVGWELRKRAS